MQAWPCTVFELAQNVKDEQGAYSLSSFWRTMAHYEGPNSMSVHCHRFKEIGSLFVCWAVSILPPHKERAGLAEDWERAVFVGPEGEGWIKIAWMHQLPLIQTGTINVSERWAICGGLCHKQAFSSHCPYDELAGPAVMKLIEGPISDGSLGNYNSLFGALQWCCADKGNIMRKKGQR